MISVGIHNCMTFRVSCHYVENGNQITLNIKGRDGQTSFTLYGLPEDVTDKLVAAFADGQTFYPKLDDEKLEEATEPEQTPEPCTEEAYAVGCTCEMRSPPIPRGEYAAIDPPEPRVSRNCPLHGKQRDPDDAYDAYRDMRMEASI
jgi:hypothetical protein